MKNKKKKNNTPTILFVIFIMVGLLIMIYPLILSIQNKNKEEEVIRKYNAKVNKINTSKYNDLIEEARLYNNNLSNTKIVEALSTNKEEENAKYLSLLNINQDGVMGYIKIPKIDVEIPIYHGTSDQALQKGVGHFESSSLPVGGIGTHSILSAHRGLPSSKLFTDLDQLIVGDMFYIYILDQTLAYKVDQIKVVEPSDLENLKIEENEDYITLVTCTPYAINTHRLLVRGTRVEYSEKELKNIRIEKKLSIPTITLGIGIILVILIIIAVVVLRKKIKTPKKEEKEEETVLEII